MKANVHSIRIDSDIARVFREIVLWGEAPWWPKRSAMRFERITLLDQPVQKGMRYRQRVLLPFAPFWDVEVSEVTETSITRRFLNGMFAGQETVSVQKKNRGVAVDYVMRYSVNGFMNKFLWSVVFIRMHDANIEMILRNLKKYLEH